MTKPQYGYAHRKARRDALAMMVNGTPCPRCNRPMYKHQRLQLGHVVSVALGGMGGPTRLEHGSCNERAGQRIGVVSKAMKRRKRGSNRGSNSKSNKGMYSVGNRGSASGGNSRGIRRSLPRW